MSSRPPRLEKPDYEALAQFRYVLRKFLHFSEKAAIGCGVTPQQYQAMLAIEGYPGRNRVTIGELAGRMCLAHQSAVGLVDRLETMGMVRRNGSREDRRCVEVSLTPKGRRLLERLCGVHRAELRVVGPELLAGLQNAVESIPMGNVGEKLPESINSFGMY